jgi:hypothetical protein
MDLKQIGCEGVDWIRVSQDKVQWWRREEEFTGFWLGVPKARNHLEDLGVGGRITLRWTLER